MFNHRGPHPWQPTHAPLIACAVMVRVWTLPTLLLTIGAASATGQFHQGNPGTAVGLLLPFLLLATTTSPLIFPRSCSASEALRRSELDGRPVIYWRPGCTYCMRLRLRLGRTAGRFHWVNIWRDADAAAAVRAANAGNETVPTVMASGRTHTNPDPAWLRDQ